MKPSAHRPPSAVSNLRERAAAHLASFSGQTAPDPERLYHALVDYADAAHADGHIITAYKAWRHAHALLPSLPRSAKPDLANLLADLLGSSRFAGDTANILAVLPDAIHLVDTVPPDRNSTAALLAEICRTFHFLDEKTKAQAFRNRAQELLDQAGPQRTPGELQAVASLLSIDITAKEGADDAVAAIKVFLSELNDDNSTVCFRAGVLVTLALAYEAADNIPMAVATIRRAISLKPYPDHPDNVSVAFMRLDLGLFLITGEHEDEALLELAGSVDTFARVFPLCGLQTTYALLQTGRAAMWLGRFADAAHAFDKAEEAIAKAFPRNDTTGVCCLDMLSSYRELLAQRSSRLAAHQTSPKKKWFSFRFGH